MLNQAFTHDLSRLFEIHKLVIFFCYIYLVHGIHENDNHKT